MSAKKPGKSMMLRMIDLVEHWGNKLPHPFWLFCFLIIAVSLLSAGLQVSGVSVTKPETQILKTDHGGQRIDGMSFAVGEPFEPFTIDLEAASHSSRLANLFVDLLTTPSRD